MNAVAESLDMRLVESASERDEETALVESARQGSRRAFESLYRTHVARVHGLCWRMCGGDESLAQEMTQSAFVRAWQKLGQFRGDSAFGTWMHRLTVNVVLGDRRSRLRQVGREQPLDEGWSEHSSAPGRQHGVAMDLEAAIARLPQRARTVLVLHDIEGYRHDEISEMADMAVGTSKAQLHRARKLIREWLGHEHE